MPLLAVASPDHPLHRLGRELGEKDLRPWRHLQVRATGSVRDRRSTTVEVEQRWTFGSMAMSIAAACAGHGFAWYPVARIRRDARNAAPQRERLDLAAPHAGERWWRALVPVEEGEPRTA